MKTPAFRTLSGAIWLVVAMLCLFIGLSILVLAGMVPVLDGLVGPVAVAFAGLSGLLGILTETKTKTGRLTAWGKVALLGVVCSLSITLAEAVIARRASAEAQLDLAADTRRAVLRQNGIRLHLAFEIDPLLPDDYDEDLARQTDRTGVIGKPPADWDWGVSSCHPAFPSLGRHVKDLAAALDGQTVFVAIADSPWEDKLAAISDHVGAEAMLPYLEEAYFSGQFASVTVHTDLAAQRADCRGGLRGDYTRITKTSAGNVLTQEYILPAIHLWRRSTEEVTSPADFPTPHILVLSSVLRDYDGAAPLSAWGVNRVVIEIPGEGVFCAQQGHPIKKLTDSLGYFSVALVPAADWRCQP